MYIKAKKGLFNKETNEGMALLSQDESKMFILNNTASRIWKFCSSEKSIEDITSFLSEQYEITNKDLKTLKKECLSLIRKNPDLFEIFNS